MGVEPERTGVEESGPTTVREQGRSVRGSLIGGKYRLEMPLGEGGMACIWSAYNVELELPVAVKLLKSGVAHERLAERLRHEARAAARLVHPHIVRVFDVAVTESGEPFIVMELLTGQSLGAELARGPIDSVSAVQLLLPIAEALAFAHDHGIVHRDVKPDNVFLSTDGDDIQPKLLDFGIAKLARPAPVPARLTEKGALLGSPNYMSPEQVLGEEVDFRSDIWSFCVLLYKAISGVTPFHGADKFATLESILFAEPNRLSLLGVDPRLERLVLWGLAKDPAARPPSMQKLARELASWLDAQGGDQISARGRRGPRRAELGTDARVPPGTRDQSTQRIVPARSRRRSWGLRVLAMLLVSGGAVWASSSVRPGATARPPAPQSPPPAAARALAHAGVVASELPEPPVSEPEPDPQPAEGAVPTAEPTRATTRPQRVMTRPRREPAPPASRLPF